MVVNLEACPAAPGRAPEHSTLPRETAILIVGCWFVIWPCVVAAQTGVAVPASAPSSIAHQLSPHLVHAIDMASEYLGRSCDPSGRFAYLVDTESGEVSPSYNIVRHAGAIYALAMLNQVHPNSGVVDVMLRATRFMEANYLAPEARSNGLAIWSRPAPVNKLAELGAAGLGLVAFTGVAQARPNAVPLSELQGLGEFVLFLQKPDGSFYSRYYADKGIDRDWQSVYYPGEAVLGLVSLYELDHSRKWLVAAGKGLAYLAASRANIAKVPADHWALIATAKFLPHYEQSACPVSRAELVQHAVRICERVIHEQITSAADARLNGGFDPGGRTTPTAIRLEGLLAALEFLPKTDANLRAQIEAAVQRGVVFLLNAQITSGPYAGGMPGAVLATGSARNVHSASEIRIDYVQHAMSAWLRYEERYRNASVGQLDRN
jgi:hypothetical protein